MITIQQAAYATNFTHESLKNKDKTPVRARRTGQPKFWKTRPNEFRIPVKYGLRQSFYITQDNAHEWNTTDVDRAAAERSIFKVN